MNTQDELIARLAPFYREAGTEVSPSPPVWEPARRRTVRWLQPVLASVVLVALAVGLAVTIRMVREEAHHKLGPLPVPRASPSPSPSLSPTPSPSPLPPPASSWVTRRVPLGQVTTMSLDGPAIFALYFQPPANGGFDLEHSMLARIDRTTGAVAIAGPFPNTTELARVTAGLWIGAGPERYAPNAGTDWLTLLDPATLKVKQRVRLPSQPNPGPYTRPYLAGSSKLLWLAYDESLYRLDPTAGRILASQSLPGPATSISIDPYGRRQLLLYERRRTRAGLGQRPQAKAQLPRQRRGFHLCVRTVARPAMTGPQRFCTRPHPSCRSHMRSRPPRAPLQALDRRGPLHRWVPTQFGSPSRHRTR